MMLLPSRLVLTRLFVLTGLFVPTRLFLPKCAFGLARVGPITHSVTLNCDTECAFGPIQDQRRVDGIRISPGSTGRRSAAGWPRPES